MPWINSGLHRRLKVIWQICRIRLNYWLMKWVRKYKQRFNSFRTFRLYGWLCMLLVCTSTITYSASMEEANELLKNKNYDQAIVQYEIMVKDGYTGFGLFFNLATAYQKQGNIARAILNFEKAIRLRPNHSVAREQINQINANLVDKPPVFDDTG